MQGISRRITRWGDFQGTRDRKEYKRLLNFSFGAESMGLVLREKEKPGWLGGSVSPEQHPTR